MKVTGLSGVTEISEVNIAYFYVRGDTVRIHYTDNSFYGLICRSHYHATISAHAFWASNYSDFVTVCGVDGISYYIKIGEVDSTLVSGNTLTITVAGAAIVVPCADEDTAEWDKDYIDSNKEGRTFLDTFGGVIRTVGPGKDFATITAGLAAATSGQAVRVYPGTYVENITVKDGVVLYMEESAILQGEVSAVETAYTFKIFGYGDFVQTGNGQDYCIFMGEATRNDTVISRLVWQFGSMTGNNYRPFFPKESRAKILLKGGLYFQTSGTAAAFLDTDNGVDIDIDMVRIAGCASATFVATNQKNTGRCKIRNLEARCISGSGVINNSSHNFVADSDYGYELVNVQFSNPTNYQGATIGFVYDEGVDVYFKGGFCRFYNCICVNEGAINSPIALHSLYANFVFETYGTNYFGGAANRAISGTTPEYNSQLGYFTQSSPENINGAIMPLTSKPKKSKFQVGETVWYFINGQLVSGVVKKTKTIMTNIADTADGEQNNLYAIGSADAAMIPESQVFRTRNMAIWKMANSNTRLNTILFNNIDSSIDFNPDLSALDLSGFDMSAVPDWTLVRLDGAKLDATTVLPESVNTLEEMKALIKSYDPVDSIWKNNETFGE